MRYLHFQYGRTVFRTKTNDSKVFDMISSLVKWKVLSRIDEINNCLEDVEPSDLLEILSKYPQVYKTEIIGESLVGYVEDVVDVDEDVDAEQYVICVINAKPQSIY